MHAVPFCRIAPVLAALGLLAGWAQADIWSRGYGPRGSLLLAKPTLRWQVWADKGAVLSRVRCTLNGASFPASYNESKREAYFVPPDTLGAGSHFVEMAATTDDGFTVTKKWEFTIRPDAMQAIPRPSQPQEIVIDYTNEWRRNCGLEPMVPDHSLSAAANLHAKYLEANKITGHYQAEGKPGFFGATPSERLHALGYIDGHYEVVQYGPASPIEAVDCLIAAPYHRIPFMQPGSPAIGGGVGMHRVVVEMGQSSQSRTVVFPYDGQRDVPVLWRGQERPNPLRVHKDLQMPTGYPIMLVHFAEPELRLEMKDAGLRTLGGADIPIRINHSGNDTELPNGVILFPVRPLAPGETYEAWVAGRLENGKTVDRRWTFTTSR